MGDLFYFFGLLIFLVNLSLIHKTFKFHKINHRSQTFMKVTGKAPKKEDFESDEWIIFNSILVIQIITTLWIFLGLLTQSWKIYLLLIIVLLPINWSIRKFGSQNLINKFLMMIKASTLTFIPLLMTLNHFHMHLDIWKLLFG